MSHPTLRTKSPTAALPDHQGGNHQRIWDACLILSYRHRQTLQDAFDLFEKTTGFSAKTPSLRISRLPFESQMDKLDSISTEYFLRVHLPTVHSRLEKSRQEFDGVFIGKMQSWNYITKPASGNASAEVLNRAQARREQAGY